MSRIDLGPSTSYSNFIASFIGDESWSLNNNSAVLTPILFLTVTCRCFIFHRRLQTEHRLDLAISASSMLYSVHTRVVTGVPLGGNAIIA